jgi:ankyrin repeat protein
MESHNVEVNANDQLENSPLHFSTLYGSKGIVEYLLIYGADVHFVRIIDTAYKCRITTAKTVYT